MAKPKPVRVPSDDCVVEIDGVEYRPHEGEWVEVIAGQSIAEFKVMRLAGELQVKVDALEGEDDAERQRAIVVDDAYSELAAFARRRLVAWNWTDDLGEPLPPPQQPGVLESLRVEEVLYLVSAAKGETPSAEKNGSRPSPTTASATRRQRSRT